LASRQSSALERPSGVSTEDGRLVAPGRGRRRGRGGRRRLVVPLGIVIEVRVDAQAVAVLVLVAAELASQALERPVDVAHVQLEVLFAREVSQAPGARVHAYHLAALHADRRAELRYDSERRLQGEAATRQALHGAPALARRRGRRVAAAARRRLVGKVAGRRARRPRSRVVETCKKK
jgi:hypothetical protein